MAEQMGRPQRFGLKRLAAIAGALLLGACSTVVPRGADTPNRAPPPPPRANAPAPITGGIPEDGQRHRVALLVPLTGPNGGVGRSIANATQMAIIDTRSEQVRITTYDTAGGAAAAARRALAEGNRLILGPLLAEDVRAVAPVARAAGVPVVGFSNDVSAAGGGAYLMGAAPSQSIERVVGYARTQGVTVFGGLVPASTYGERASTAFLRAAESAGGQVVSLQTYAPAPGAIAAAVARMTKNAPFQAVLIADGSGAAAAAVPLLRRGGSPSVRILGTDRWNADNSIATKPALNGAWFASVSDNLYAQYAAKYRVRFGSGPYRLSSLGYDAVLLTVRIARDWPLGRPFPEDRLRDRGGFSGIDGAFRFGRDGVAERALEVQEVRGGAVATISPAPGDFGK